LKTAQTQLQPPRTAAESRGLLKTEALDTHALEPEKADPELQVARAQIRQQQDTITHLQRQVREVVSIVRNTEHHLAAVAKTRPYRFAHFLRRWERDCLKGDWEDLCTLAAASIGRPANSRRRKTQSPPDHFCHGLCARS